MTSSNAASVSSPDASTSAAPGRLDDSFARRAENVASILGSNAELARVLHVDRSRVTRWVRSQESPGPRAARELIDLDFVVARARLVLHDDAIGDWLDSPNLHLNGATPLSLIEAGRAESAIAALEAFDEGGYA